MKSIFLFLFGLVFFGFLALAALFNPNLPETNAADPCQVSVSVGPTFWAGSPIHIQITNAAPFTNYRVVIDEPRASNVYNQTRSSGPIVSGGDVLFPDYLPPIAGNYVFHGDNLTNGQNCSNSPKTVSVVPGAQCILSSVNTTQIAGKPVSFTVSGLAINHSYIVELIIENTDTGSKRVADAKTTTITSSSTEWSDTFDGNLFLEAGGSIIYSVIARQTSPTAEVCQNQNVHWDIIELVSGKNPCYRDINGDGIIDCETAIGNISTDIGKFAQKILAIGIGLAGGIALIIMVIGSIRVLTSAGDPKNVAAGREMIIAAVAGLLFLIFSVLILQFIGFDILRIPNFG